ncbi:hypothetical protein C8F01DRAFT_1153468 [Mycena amicta]|nr:hypothetical protein C8F01DRAFT_1153468 [Mycena amicta]
MSALPPGPPPATTVFTGPIDDTRTLKDLQAICTALNTKQSRSKVDCASSIITILHNFPSVHEDDPRFAQIYAYHKEKGEYGRPASKEKSKAKAKAKSTDKVAEEKEERSKPQKALTGAALKLHQGKVTTDPPAKTVKLQTSKPKRPSGEEEDKSDEEKSNSSPLTDVSPLPVNGSEHGSDDDSEHDANENKEVKKPGETTTGSVLLRLLSFPSNNNGPSKSIFVKDVPIIINKATPGGTQTSETSLTSLLAASIASNSPLKADRTGRFFRRALDPEDEAPIDLGSVNNHDGGILPDILKHWKRADTYTLKASTLDKDVFECDIFYSPGPTGAVSAAAYTGPSDPAFVPLAVAQTRPPTAQAPKVKPTKLPSTEEAYQFIRDIFQLESIILAKKSTLAGDGLANHRAWMAFKKRYDDFEHQTYGYRVPIGYVLPANISGSWGSNVSFTIEQLQHAAGLGKSATNANTTLFESAAQLDGKIGRWVNSDTNDIAEEDLKKLNKKYAQMNINEPVDGFKARVQKLCNEQGIAYGKQSKKAKAGEDKVAGKRKRGEAEGSRKKKRAKSIDTIDMDNDTDKGSESSGDE